MRSFAIGRCAYLNEIKSAESNGRTLPFVPVIPPLHDKVADNLSALIMSAFPLFLHEATDSTRILKNFLKSVSWDYHRRLTKYGKSVHAGYKLLVALGTFIPPDKCSILAQSIPRPMP